MPHNLVTSDGVTIEAVHEPGPGSRSGLAFIVAHGFTGSWRKPSVRAVVNGLSSYGGVLSFDFRGHGNSGGQSTLGDLEVRDVDAVLCWARSLGYARIATVGWSMGASVVVRQAALSGGVDAVVAISGPSTWFYRGTTPMRRAHQLFARRHGRALLRYGRGTRIAPAHWDETRPASWCESPVDVAGRIAPTPLLVVHGDRDSYFPVDSARRLFDAAAQPKTLWVEPGFGHAEGAASAALVARVGAWARAAAGTVPSAAQGSG